MRSTVIGVLLLAAPLVRAEEIPVAPGESIQAALDAAVAAPIEAFMFALVALAVRLRR